MDTQSAEVAPPEAVPSQGGVDSPTEISAVGWKETGRRVTQKAKADRVSMMAGSIAYHGFLAVFPLAIALVGISQFVGLSSSTITTLERGIGHTLPQGASTVLNTAVTTARHRTAGTLTVTVIAILVAIWSASGGMSVVETGLDVAYEVPEDRKFLARRLHGLLLVCLVVVLGGAASALIVFAKPLGHELEQVGPVSGQAFNIPWTVLRWVVTIVLMITLFGLLYRYGPNRKPPRWRWISPGGLVGTAIWLAASFGLSFYVSEIGSYGKTYGALAGVAVFLFWFYLTALAVLIGGQLNAEVERQAQLETGPVSPDGSSGRLPRHARIR